MLVDNGGHGMQWDDVVNMDFSFEMGCSFGDNKEGIKEIMHEIEKWQTHVCVHEY